MKHLFLLSFLIWHTSLLKAQIVDSSHSLNLGKEIIDYQKVKEGNLHWMKRVWREIDVNEKMNLVFQYNKQPLYFLIKDAVSTGDLQVYSNDTIYPDELQKLLSFKEAQSVGCLKQEIEVMDVQTFDLHMKDIYTCPKDKDIVKYRVMEDWYFDKNTSTMKVHIVSVSPIMEIHSTEGEFIGYTAMYWLNFDQLRNILVKYPVYNSSNDESKFSWDDLFLARTFSSVIIKESNVFDRNIASYAVGIDAVLESERLHTEMFNREQDSWSY